MTEEKDRERGLQHPRPLPAGTFQPLAPHFVAIEGHQAGELRGTLDENADVVHDDAGLSLGGRLTTTGTIFRTSWLPAIGNEPAEAMHMPEAPDAPRSEVQAQTDLHERAVREFLQTIEPWTDDSLTERLAADARWTNQKILVHVVGCIYVPHINWMLEKLALNPVPRPFSNDRDEVVRYLEGVDSIAGWRKLLEGAVPYVRAVAAQMTDNDLTKEFTCDWGDRYSIDQMFEHSTMHLYRHIRQIERDRAAKAGAAGE